MDKSTALVDALSSRVLILDGGFGTMLQSLSLPAAAFSLPKSHISAPGCNDVLCITRPDVVLDIHRQYIEAGADIISTNSFNANAISLADYGLEGHAYVIARRAARLARVAADKRPGTFVAGSMGPTNRTLSISPDVSRPDHRDVTWSQMVDAYTTQAQGLIDGGAHLILIETAFDSLNAKAAIMAVRAIDENIPVIISCTVSDAGGRTLSGQTIEAFCASVAHARPLAIGVNCGYGAKHLLPYCRRLAAAAPCFVSVHPNAGLPNIVGGYDETPRMFAADMAPYVSEGIANIVGGCCGTTPLHIAALKDMVEACKAAPRRPAPQDATILAGLEPLKVMPSANFINIGERCNVAGSAKFVRLIREGKYEAALSIARAQVDAGAQVVDVCMDDALISGPEAMARFLRLIAAEPEIARVPLMIDSSSWATLEAGMQCAQGKSIVNSISLKEGEDAFLQRAAKIMQYGAAAVVMLFDEKGQATSFERKIEIAERAYSLLKSIGFNTADIIFDPNVLAVATGIADHDRYALDFIEATRWIKSNLPGTKVSGGISNLSFAFRGNNAVRKAMHAAFLYHAIAAGLDMGLVNPQMVTPYCNIPPALLQAVEDVLLCRRPDAAERLAEIAKDFGDQAKADSPGTEPSEPLPDVATRLSRALLKGDTAGLDDLALEAYRQEGSAIAVISNMLMPAMRQVGELFGEGKLFLPQVVKSARVMKQAVDALVPFMHKAEEDDSQAHAIVLATVKGDVHDIGKNIVAVVLACNGFKVIDLGVMAEPEAIVAEAARSHAIAIGLSGLITPSLHEMTLVAQEAQRQGLATPIIIGGATTSPLHTAVKIAAATSAPVIHARDAADTARIAHALCGEERNALIAHNAEQQRRLRASYMAAGNAAPAIIAPAASADAPKHQPLSPLPVALAQPSLADLIPHIDWSFFFAAWGLPGSYPQIFSHPRRGQQAKAIYDDALAMLDHATRHSLITVQGVKADVRCRPDGDDIVLLRTDDTEHARLPMLRSASGKCVADFAASGHITLFTICATQSPRWHHADDYEAFMAKFLCDRLAEAMAARWLSHGCRIAIGYPAAPDHSLKQPIFELLDVAAHLPLTLTENYMISPAESICGLCVDEGSYFEMGQVEPARLEAYAKRRGLPVSTLAPLINRY